MDAEKMLAAIVEAIAEICSSHDRCCSCSLENICNGRAPWQWNPNAEVKP